MLNFIHANLAPLVASGMLVAFFGYGIYLNVAYSNEKKREEARRNTDPIHRTCKLDTTLQDREMVNKLVDVTMNTGLAILESIVVASTKNANPVQAALHPDTVK